MQYLPTIRILNTTTAVVVNLSQIPGFRNLKTQNPTSRVLDVVHFPKSGNVGAPKHQLWH